MTIYCVVGAQVAIDVLAGNRAGPAVPVLRIQGLTLLSTGIAVACGYGLLTLRRYRAMLVDERRSALALSVVLTLALVPGHGARGAAIATFGAETALALTVLWVLLRARPALRGGVAGAPAILLVAGAAIAAGLLTGLPAVAGMAVANVVFVAGLAVVRRFPPELREALSS